MALSTISMSISGLEGDIEDQLSHTSQISAHLSPMDQFLSVIANLDKQCQEANIEENDYTTYTYEELVYELGLVRSSVQKKLVFLENQIVAREMTNLTPIQLEEFESVFRHFDRDNSGSIDGGELSEALRQFGYNLSPQLLVLLERKYGAYHLHLFSSLPLLFHFFHSVV